jgi:hypothetical protein
MSKARADMKFPKRTLAADTREGWTVHLLQSKR